MINKKKQIVMKHQDNKCISMAVSQQQNNWTHNVICKHHGGFQLEFASISLVGQKSLVCYLKKNPLQDLLSSLNAMISTNKRTWIITGHVIYNLAYVLTNSNWKPPLSLQYNFTLEYTFFKVFQKKLLKQFYVTFQCGC